MGISLELSSQHGTMGLATLIGLSAVLSGAVGQSQSLEENIPGVPGDDYPIFAQVPDTSFVCDGLVEGGYYADPETECQVFHICGNDGNGGLTKYSFLCPNGTIFQQQYFVCDWWFNVDCSLAESLYFVNEEVAAEREANTGAGGAYEEGQTGGQNGSRSQNGGQNGSRGQTGSQNGSRGQTGGQTSSRGQTGLNGSRGQSVSRGQTGGQGVSRGQTGGQGVSRGQTSGLGSYRGQTGGQGGSTGQTGAGGQRGLTGGSGTGGQGGGRQAGRPGSRRNTQSQPGYLSPASSEASDQSLGADTGYGAPVGGEEAFDGAGDFPLLSQYTRNTRDSPNSPVEEEVMEEIMDKDA